MKNATICKFNSSRSGDLICENFIFESQDAQKEPLTSSRFVMNLVCEGQGAFSCDQNRYEVSEGDVFFVLKGERFSVASLSEEEPLSYRYISFNGRRAGANFRSSLH